jgi:hypothetical protein
MSRIIILIDESGSMSSQKYEVIDGINTMINSQRKLQETDITMDLIKFNTGVCHCYSKKLSQFPCITSKDYSPNGGTALYDAIGSSISKYSNETGVTMVITTDGMENSSKEFNKDSVVKLIDAQKLKKDWNFIYLSEDPTTVHQGYTMGFNNTTGSNNICVGYRQSGQNLTSGNFNCYLGERSQQKTSMDYSTWMKHKN